MVTALEILGAHSAHWAGEPEIAAAEEVFDVFIYAFQTPRSDDKRTRIRGDEFPCPACRAGRQFDCSTRKSRVLAARWGTTTHSLTAQPTCACGTSTLAAVHRRFSIHKWMMVSLSLLDSSNSSSTTWIRGAATWRGFIVSML